MFIKEKKIKNHTLIRTDGASRGNPGPSAAAAIIEKLDGSLIRVAKRLPDGTNNVAEYEAVILGLEVALEEGLRNVTMVSDSTLIVNQINGYWAVKDERLRELHITVSDLVGELKSFRIYYAPREQGVEVDKLANRLLNSVNEYIHEVVSSNGDLLP